MKRIVLLTIFLVVFIVGCTSAQPTTRVVRTRAATPRPASTSSFAQYSAQLYCPECKEIGMEINIWTTASRAGISGSFPHGTTVTVIGQQTSDGVVHYKIKKGNITGYVSHMMIKK